MKHIGKTSAIFPLLIFGFLLLFGMKMPIYAAENTEFVIQDPVESPVGQDVDQAETPVGDPGNVAEVDSWL